MAPRADLKAIGRDGFSILETALQKKRNAKPGGGDRSGSKEVIDSEQAARQFQGVCIPDDFLGGKNPAPKLGAPLVAKRGPAGQTN
ncbi:hypothetical protein CJ030_MR8G028813 [Morella rubra]|uniref:Uncharacterized protein n=1 Tax=Morella rubra TaxID=262757 RepID=A0A6A1URY5_9ROSI|nr:hypothetical protein CJ030_MR8G028813 [Morella rubra]